MYKLNKPLLCTLVLILLLTGCSLSPVNKTATSQAAMPPTATNTQLPTRRPTASATPTVTLTPSPVPTNTPTVTMTVEAPGEPVTKFVDGVKITSFDGFGTLDTGKWELVSDRVVVEDGMVRMDGKIYRDTRLINNDIINAKEGVIFDFKFTLGSQLYAYLDYSMFIKDDYRRFGVETGTNTQTNIHEGIDLLPEALLVGNLTPQPDTWYSMLLAVDEGAEMLVLIWNPERPETRIRYFGNYKESWENLPWHFTVSLNKGNVTIDNVRKFTFTDIKLP